MSKVQYYDFDKKYKKGNMNVVANSLSRKPNLYAMEAPMDWKEKLSLEYSRNKFACVN